MQLLQLANFLLHNLLQSRISFIVIFHCWQRNESARKEVEHLKRKFSLIYRFLLAALQLAQQFHQSPRLIFHQFVHLSQWNWEHLEERYLDHKQPTLAIYVDLNCVKTRALLIEVRIGSFSLEIIY